jgi:hypothetical protein
MYWKGKKPSKLLGDDAQLVAEEGTVLVDYSSKEDSSHRHVYMVEVEGEGNEDPNELPEQMSGDRAPPTSVMRMTLSVMPAD